MFDILAAPKEKGACHRRSVTESQENDTNTGERTESRRRSEIDQAQKQFDDHSQDQSIEGDSEGLVHLAKEGRKRNCTVTSESPCATRSRSDACDATADTQNQNGNSQAECADIVARSVKEDCRDRVIRLRQVVEILGEDKRNGDDIAETSNHVHDHSTDDSVRDLDSRATNFLTHAIPSY